MIEHMLIKLIPLTMSIIASVYLGFIFGYEKGWRDKLKRKKHMLRN